MLPIKGVLYSKTKIFYLRNWSSLFLKNRKLYVSLHGVSFSINTVTCVIPQGSTLGPLLFLLCINDLQCAFSKSIIHSFAEDANLLFSSKDLGTIESVINNDLKYV